MAYYKYAHFLHQEDEEAFDLAYEPAATVPISGIYRCTGCGKSTTAVKDKHFPAHGTPQHGPAQDRIRWQLVVRSHWVGGY